MKCSVLSLAVVGTAMMLGGSIAAQDKNAPSAVSSPDGKLIVSAADRAITVSDAQMQKELIRIMGHKERVTALAFSPDGKLLASGSKDKTVALWDITSGLATAPNAVRC